MWGQPKRSGRCPRCKARGRCSCQRRDNAVAAQNPDAAPRTCTAVCQPKRGTCGKTIRGGTCPCPYC